jgi:hypothetical protein
VKRIRAAQYAGNRRNGFRFDVFLRGELQGQPCILRDVSLTGALVESYAADLERGQTIDLTVLAGETPYHLKAEVIRVRETQGTKAVALRFLPGQRDTLGALALYILNGRIRPERAPKQRPRRKATRREVAAA